MKIDIDDPRRPDVIALLEDHLASMRANSPPEHVHALDLDGLTADGIAFYTARRDGELLGCGALKVLCGGDGELKSMKTARASLRQGVARALLTHIVDEATRRGFRRLLLETGTGLVFDPALRMYEAAGFSYRDPFAGYTANEFSVFMERTL